METDVIVLNPGEEVVYQVDFVITNTREGLLSIPFDYLNSLEFKEAVRDLIISHSIFDVFKRG